MHISIHGAGHAGTAVAADLSLRGHEVPLIKTSRATHDGNFSFLLGNGGRICRAVLHNPKLIRKSCLTTNPARGAGE